MERDLEARLGSLMASHKQASQGLLARLYLPISPCISLYLPVSPKPRRACWRASGPNPNTTLTLALTVSLTLTSTLTLTLILTLTLTLTLTPPHA